MASSKSTRNLPHKWATSVTCMVFVDDIMLTNRYNFEIGFFSINPNPVLNDIGFDQVDMFFSMLMSNAIIVDRNYYSKSLIINDLKNNKIMVPGKGNDQVVGSLVFLKLLSIIGENLELDYVTITSELGKDICYTITADSLEIEALVPKKADWWEDDKVKYQPWWNRPDSATYDLLTDGKLYTGDFEWKEIFKDEYAEAEDYNKPALAKGKVFKLIPGGKDVH